MTRAQRIEPLMKSHVVKYIVRGGGGNTECSVVTKSMYSV